MSYLSKVGSLSTRELETQTVIAIWNLVAASSNLAAETVIDNSTIGATVITLDVGEPVKKCLCVDVSNRATGAVIVHTAAPDVSVANKISVTVDGTGQTDVCIKFTYIIA